MSRKPHADAKQTALRALADWKERDEELQAELEETVRQAREVGASWEEIGYELGVTKQAAHKKFGSLG